MNVIRSLRQYYVGLNRRFHAWVLCATSCFGILSGCFSLVQLVCVAHNAVLNNFGINVAYIDCLKLDEQ